MRHLFLDKGSLKIKDVAQPLLDDHAVLVTVHYAFLCSKTEVEQVAKAHVKLLRNLPQKIKKVLKLKTAAPQAQTTKGSSEITKRSCVGQVIAVGKKIKGIHQGDWIACIAGGDNYTDLICVPEHLVAKVSKKEILYAASITGPGTIALQAVRRAGLTIGEVVIVIGLGIVGQLIIQLAKLSGCMVIAIDRYDGCLEVAKKSGAAAVYNSNQENIFRDIAYLTEHRGADVTFVNDSSLFSEIDHQVFASTRKKGSIVIVDQHGPHFKLDNVHEKEIDIISAGLYGPGYDDPLYQEGFEYPFAHMRWTVQRNMQAFIQLLERGDLTVDHLLSKEVTVNQIKHAYDYIHTKQSCGVIFRYQLPRPEQIYKLRVNKKTFSTALIRDGKDIRFMPATTDIIRVGIVGIGSFAKTKLLPTLSNMKNVHINAIVDADYDHAVRMSQLYGATKAYRYDDELLRDDIVDLVIIASPHKFHADQALKALYNGKAVLVEKPMVTDFEQLQKMSAFIQKFPGVPFCVDYHRSFAPFIQKIKKVVQKRRAPLMMQYRMNAETIERKHWMQTDIGAGRIIGDSCHIIDLFCFLCDAQPTAVSVEAMHTSRDDIFPTDNFSAQVRFSDGSICSLFYTALGHERASKERMEIFFDSKGIVMEDYVTLRGFGLPSWFDEVVSSPDRGHAILINSFVQALSKDHFISPISFDRLYTGAQLTLIIDQLACEGGGIKKLTIKNSLAIR